MKKIYLIVMFGICFLLGACGAENPEDLFGSAEDIDLKPSQEGEDELAELAEGSNQTVLTAEADYQYGNMQKNLPPGNYMRYGEDIVFTELHNEQFLLYTYDMETGEVSTLYKDATNMDGISTMGNLEVYNGELFIQNDNYKIVQVLEGQVEPVVDGKVYSFWHANGNLYAKTRDSSLLVFEKGSKEARILIDEFTSNRNVVFGKYLYGQGDALTRVDLSTEELQEEVLLKNVSAMIDGEYIYYADETDDYHLYRCSMDGSDPVLLLDKSVLPASMNFDDTYYYFRLFTDMQIKEGDDCYDVYRFPKEDPARIEKIATLPIPAYNIFTVPGYDKIFVTTVGEDTPTYVMGLDGSDPTPLALPDF